MTVEERERQRNLYGSSQEHDALVFPVSTGELCRPTGLNPVHDGWPSSAESQVFSMKMLEKYIKKLYITSPLRDERKHLGPEKIFELRCLCVYACVYVCV